MNRLLPTRFIQMGAILAVLSGVWSAYGQSIPIPCEGGKILCHGDCQYQDQCDKVCGVGRHWEVKTSGCADGPPGQTPAETPPTTPPETPTPPAPETPPVAPPKTPIPQTGEPLSNGKQPHAQPPVVRKTGLGDIADETRSCLWNAAKAQCEIAISGWSRQTCEERPQAEWHESGSLCRLGIPTGESGAAYCTQMLAGSWTEADRLCQVKEVPLTAPVPSLEQPTIMKKSDPTTALRHRFSPWTWVTLSAGLALAAGGGAAYGLGEADRREAGGVRFSPDAHPDGLSMKQVSDLRDRCALKKDIGYALWGVGGAALASSVVLFVVEAVHRPKVAGPVGAARAVGAVPLQGGAALLVQGGF